MDLASIQAMSDAKIKEDTLSRSKGKTPEHVLARKNVARTFCEIHLPDEASADREARLASIDYTQPVCIINARGVDTEKPKAKGFLGMGPKPQYLISRSVPPKSPEDPIYAMEYIALRS